MNTAQIILQQLGGNKFIAMTGAKNFVVDGYTLRMTLPRNGSKANRLWITLDADEGVLEYDAFGKHLVKPFDMTQATPEIAADMVQWCFSMLDATANLD